jgi:uncharacterized membrane protein
MDMMNEGHHNRRTQRLARSLGGLSFALGVASIAASRAVCRLAGVDDSMMAPAVVRVAGVRELGHAAGLLGTRRPEGWVWTRVAGDAMDLTALAMAMRGRRDERRRRRTVLATVAVAGITAADVLTAIRATRFMRARERAMRFKAAVTVNRPPDEVYRFWHDLENLPRFMYHLESVRMTGDRRSHWTAKGPAGRAVEWEAEIIEDKPDRVIAWRSMEGSKIPNSGSVRFMMAAGGRGTEVRVELGYAPPGGKIGKAVAKLFGEEPEQQVRDDLRRFKQVIETGEVAQSEGSPTGLSVRQQVMQRPARPMAGVPR